MQDKDTQQKAFFIPLNDVPNEDQLLGIDTTKTSVTESTGASPETTKENMPNDSPGQVDFVWGFMFFDMHEIYAEGNKIFFNGEVTKASMEELKRTMIYVGKRSLMAYHELGIHDVKDMHLELHINSPGGCMSSGWAMIDFMSNFYMPIHTYGTGTVASMGVMLLIAGERRYVTPNTHLLVHQFSAGIQGKRQLILDYIKHFEHIHEQSIRFLSEKTNLGVDDVAAMLKNESWLTAEEAMTKGFADAIK